MTKPDSKQIFGMYEWAARSENCINGCANNCAYCYAKASAIQYGRATAESWATEVQRPGALKRSIPKGEGRIMFPSTHDISPENMDFCLAFLARLLATGCEVLLTTKPHLSVVKEICERYRADRGRILFRFTIGSNNNNVLKLLEPGATKYEERIASLVYAYENGFETSISMEPMLDLYPGAVVDAALPWITDSIWLGKINYPIKRMQANQAPREAIQYVRELIADQHDDWARSIYEKYRDNPKVKYKESLKKVLGLELATEAGQDK